MMALNAADHVYESEMEKDYNMTMQTFEDNKRLIAMRREERERARAANMSKPDIGDDYFAQFGTSHR